MCSYSSMRAAGWWSGETGGLRDRTVEHLLGKHFTEAYELQDPEEEAAVAQRVLESGEPVVNRLIPGFEAPGQPGRRIYSVSYFRLEDPHGDVLGLVAYAVDVTERENAQNLLAPLDTPPTRLPPPINASPDRRELLHALAPP